MQALGDTLREARMRQKIDITEVEAKTKIRAKYLRALENEEFDMLPGPTYVRSFLRTYAAFLGLDAQLLVEEYRVRHESAEVPEVQPLTAPPSPPTRERRYGRGPPPPGVVIGLAAAALLVFLLILGLTGGSDENKPSKTAAGRARTERKERKRAAAAPAEKPRPRRVTLRVAPLDPTYVCIDDARGKIVFEGIVEKARTFRRRRLRINLGKRSAKLRVNGRRVPIEPGSEPVGFAFTPAGGRKDLPPGQRPCA
jgi:cytoskeleton protein RodZ